MLVQLTGEQRGGDGVRRKLRDGESPPCPGSAQPGCRRARGSLVCPLTCWGPALAGGYIRRAVLAGASLAVLRGRGSLSVFVLLLLHLLHDFPDLALGSLSRARNRAWGGHQRLGSLPPPPATPELSPRQAVSAPRNSITTLQLLTPGQAQKWFCEK